MRRRVTAVLGLTLSLLLSSRWALAADERPRYVRISGFGAAELALLEELGDVDGVDRDGTVRLYTSEAGLAELRARGFAVEELPDPGLNPDPGTPRPDGTVPEAWDAYPSWSGYVAMLQQFETDCGTVYADVCHLVDLGPSANTVRPHRLYAIRISDHPSLDEDEPEVLLTSSIHGDETVGAMLLLHLTDELLRNYDPASSDPAKMEITALVDGLDLWINPFANPDGTWYTNDGQIGTSGSIRYATNANGTNSGIDMNRNFPDPVEGLYPNGAWRLEVQTMMAFASVRRFALSANFHGGAEVVNYPWDVWCTPHVHPDDAWWRVIARDYATHAQSDGPAGYMNDLDNGITEGCDWYPIDGGRQDYMNYWQNGREMTIEVSSTKNPAGSSLPTYWTANRQALLDLLKQPHAGVRGLVRDLALAPLAAHVEVVGRDKEHSHVATDPAVGDYHRMLLPGTYTLRFYAAGHQTLTVPGVVVGSSAATRLDVTLDPVPGELFADGFDFGGAVGWTLAFP